MRFELPPIEDVKVRVLDMRIATGEDMISLPPERLHKCMDPLSNWYGVTFVETEITYAEAAALKVGDPALDDRHSKLDPKSRKLMEDFAGIMKDADHEMLLRMGRLYHDLCEHFETELQPCECSICEEHR